LLLAGQLTEVLVPSIEVQAARELTRGHDAIGRDLMNARHRVAKHPVDARPGLPGELDLEDTPPTVALQVRRQG
jgi:hypothetical protein